MKVVAIFLLMAMCAYSAHGASEAIGEGITVLLDALGFNWCKTHQCAWAPTSGVRCVDFRKKCGCEKPGELADHYPQWKCICDRSRWGGGFGDCPA